MDIQLLTVPDPRLRQKSKPVEEIDDYIRELSKEMLARLDVTVDGVKYIGVSACQFGEMIQLIAIKLQGLEIVLANPSIVKSTGRRISIEGCMSIPGKLYQVHRPKIVKVRGLTLNGTIKTIKGHDLLAACLCHETDHCSGVMIDTLGYIVPGR